VQVKCALLHEECRRGAHLPSLGRDKPLKSVTHGQCDTRLTVTFPAAGLHRPLTSIKLCCLATEALVCEQLARGCYLKARGLESNSESQIQRRNHHATRPHSAYILHYFIPKFLCGNRGRNNIKSSQLPNPADTKTDVETGNCAVDNS